MMRLHSLTLTGSRRNMSNWKPVKGYEDRYLISDSGMVWSLYQNKPLKPNKSKNGYLLVHLKVNNKRDARYIHRLVAEHFIPNEHNHSTVNHINRNKHDNRVANLEWMTLPDNVKYSACKKVVATNKDSGESRTFNSVSECAAFLDCNTGAISHVLSGRHHSSQGNTFSYATE